MSARPPAAADLLARVCAPGGDPRPAPRTVIVSAHPDDEVIGAGCRLPRLRDAVTLVQVTDGSPKDLYDARRLGFGTREEYAAARRAELRAALAEAGVDASRAVELGVPDQEASQDLADLACRLAALFADARPEVVLTHPYEGGHPDHDAAAFAVHAAFRLLGDAAPPLLAEFTSYHNGPAGITPFEFLPCGEDPDGAGVVTCELEDEERALKGRLFGHFPTQRETLQYFPIAVERFRPAPRYDFCRPPHAGTLFYENFGWGGVTGERFCALARRALAALSFEELQS